MDNEEFNRRVEIMEEQGGIQPMFEVFYIDAIVSTTTSAFISLNRFYYGLKTDDHNMATNGLDSFLVHSAAVSRYFFPSHINPKGKPRPKTKLRIARSKKLKDAFEISEGSPLANRELRDALEHYDERLDNFLLGDLAGNFFPQPQIGSYDDITDPVSTFFKFIDPHTHKYILFGEVYEYGNIALELQRIHNKAQVMSKNGALTTI